MLKAFEGFQPGVERMRGYKRAMEEAGLGVDEKLIKSVSFGSRHVIQSVYSLLLDREVTALVDCSATEDAASIREGARRAGRTLGKDVELVTWTYTPNATVMSEACAHVWLPVRESASEGLELLAKRIRERSDEPIHILYPPTLYETVDTVEVPKPIPMFEVFS